MLAHARTRMISAGLDWDGQGRRVCRVIVLSVDHIVLVKMLQSEQQLSSVKAGAILSELPFFLQMEKQLPTGTVPAAHRAKIGLNLRLTKMLAPATRLPPHDPHDTTTVHRR